MSSRNVEISPSLRGTATEKVGRLGRFVDGMERADVLFSEERNPRIELREVCEVTMYGHGRLVRARVDAADHFAAIDGAVAKLEVQLHKLKSRLIAKHHGKGHVGPKSAAAAADAEEEPPRLVKTKRFAMKPMTTDEAILQMELLGHEFFFFANADTGDFAVVYRRADGDIGLIEPED